MKMPSMFCSLLILLLSIAQRSFSQLEFAVGIKGGVNSSSLNYDPELYSGTTGVSTTGGTRLAIGGVVALSPSSVVSLQFEPRYIQKVNKWERGNYSEEVELREFELPVLLVLKPFKSQLRPYLLAGPNVGFVLTGRDFLDRPGVRYEQNIRTSLSYFDVSLDLGLGGEYRLSEFSVTAEARYSHGVSDLDNTISNQRIKSRSIQFLVGFLFVING